MTYAEELTAAWANARASKSPDAPTVVSTFSGGGGSSLGYKMAGFDVRAAVEWGAYPAACYRLNFPETPVIEGDISKVSVDDLLSAARLRPGELDVLDGSPPCQGFSTSGNREVGDPRNSLFKEYVRLLRGLRPKALVMENVSGMVKGKMLWVFKQIIQELRSAGYLVQCQVLNAKWFGVPQSRQRTIFIGVRDDLGIEPSHPRAERRPITISEACPWLASLNKRFAIDKEPVNTIPKMPGGVFDPATKEEGLLTGVSDFKTGFQHGKRVVLSHSSIRGKKKTVAGVFVNPWQIGEAVGIEDQIPTIMKNGISGAAACQFLTAALGAPQEYLPAPPIRGKAADLAASMLPGQRGSDILGNGSWRDLVRLDPDTTSPTIMKNAHWVGQPSVLHPTEVRGLSVGEVMRLSSFPDGYRFVELGTTRKDWEQAWGVVGNAVPPMFMRAIAAHVRSILKGAGCAEAAVAAV